MIRGNISKAATTALLALVLVAPAQAASPEARLLDGIDRARARHGLPALRDSAALTSSARRQSRAMLAKSRFAHAPVLHAPGRWRVLGECIGLEFRRRPGPGSILRSWMRSPTHRALVLSTRFRQAGVGAVQGRYGGRRAIAWTLRVGRR